MEENLIMKKTALIVDDDAMSRGLIRMVLEYDAFHCLEAENGETALRVLDNQKIDLIILDLIMPKVTGLEVLTVLRQTTNTWQPRIMIISGLLNPEIRSRATQLGAHAILEKPYDLGELRTLASDLCSPQPDIQSPHSYSRS
jgi:DNA-binding response OmpR family regulator